MLKSCEGWLGYKNHYIFAFVLLNKLYFQSSYKLYYNAGNFLIATAVLHRESQYCFLLTLKESEAEIGFSLPTPISLLILYFAYRKAHSRNRIRKKWKYCDFSDALMTPISTPCSGFHFTNKPLMFANKKTYRIGWTINSGLYDFITCEASAEQNTWARSQPWKINKN